MQKEKITITKQMLLPPLNKIWQIKKVPKNNQNVNQTPTESEKILICSEVTIKDLEKVKIAKKTLELIKGNGRYSLVLTLQNILSLLLACNIIYTLGFYTALPVFSCK